MTRLVNRVLALVIGAALLAGGLVVIVEASWTWSNSGFVVIPGSSWLSTFKSTLWSAPIVIAISAGVAALGLVLFLFQVRPHPKRLVPYRVDGDGSWFMLRRSAERRLQRRLATKVPVSPIKVRLKPHAARWSLKVKARAASSSKPVLEDAGRAELASLRAPKLSKVRVTTTGANKAAS